MAAIPGDLGELTYDFAGPAREFSDQRLLQQLGMPPDAMLVRFRPPLPTEFDGYDVTFLGRYMEEAGDWPMWRIFWESLGGSDVIHFQLWHQTVTHGDCRVALDVRWHPDEGTSESITGLQFAHTQKDIERLQRLLPILREEVARRGRRPLDPVAVRDALYAALDRYRVDNNGNYPNNYAEDLCGLIVPPKSRDTIIDWVALLRKNDIAFPPPE